MSSVLLLTVVYVFVGRLERAPALRFRPLLSPRPYLATDLAWYGVAIAATALSVFVFRPVLRYLSIGPVRDAIAGAPFLVKLLIGVLVFDLVVVRRASRACTATTDCGISTRFTIRRCSSTGSPPPEPT